MAYAIAPHIGLCLPGHEMLKSTQVSTSEKGFEDLIGVLPFEAELEMVKGWTCVRLLVRELDVAVGGGRGNVNILGLRVGSGIAAAFAK